MTDTTTPGTADTTAPAGAGRPLSRRGRKSARARWAGARTLADLGELTALWLEGDIAKTPNYDGHPADETRELVPVLAACNRAGFVTDTSQPGVKDDGTGWEQRAGVQGFASPETAERLRLAAATRGLIVHVLPAARRMSYKQAIPVSLEDGNVFTRFGAQLSRRFLRDPWEGYGSCHRDAVDALCNAQQVTIVDPELGRNDRLWPVLEQFAKEA